MYKQSTNEEDDEDIPFLPRIREGYKYLGLIQTDRDTLSNIERVRQIVNERVEPILRSELSPAQKIHMLNTTVIPAILYVMGNVYLRESRASTLAKCKAIDSDIRKKLVLYKLHGRTTSKAVIYIRKELSGLGLHSIKNETEVQYVRKGIYLEHHPDMTEVKARYDRLVNAGWRNPLSDARAVLEEYALEIPPKAPDKSACEYAREITKIVKKAQQQRLQEAWATSAHYARLVIANAPALLFPAYQSIYAEDWILSLSRSAGEEQVHGLGSNPATRRRCRLGCNADENAYHVSSSCVTPAYNDQHDRVVYFALRNILMGTGAPKHILSQLRFGKAAMVSEYMWGRRRVKVKAEVKVVTDPELYHNRPDIVVCLTNPNEVYVFEIAVSHLQNIKVQEEIKKTRYGKNSMDHITHRNFKDVHRSFNICEALGRMYKSSSVKLGVLVMGTFGEILQTDIHKQCIKYFGELGINDRMSKKMLSQCSLEVYNSTAKIMLRRIGHNSVDEST